MVPVAVGSNFSVPVVANRLQPASFSLAPALQSRVSGEKTAEKYSLAFKNEDGIIPITIKTDRTSAWHLYILRLNLEALTIDRNKFIIGMKERGIGTSVHFKPIYRFTDYKNSGYTAADYPESEWVYERTLSLPIYPDLSDKETDYVIENVLDIIKNNRR